MPDVQGKLDEIITMVETAKSKALSGSSAVIDRPMLLGALDELRQLLPAEMSEARSLLRERTAVHDAARAQADEILGRAHAEAEQIRAAAHEERARLVSESDVVDEADRTAAGITEEAEAQAVRMREQTDDYVDASLARFEQLLSASLETVSRGRARVADARADAAAAAGHYGQDPGGYEQGQGTPPGSGATFAEHHEPEALSWDSTDASESTATPAS